MSSSIVIAHYNENLNWLSRIDTFYLGKIYIYSKREDSVIPNFIKDSEFFCHKIIPNLGRESGTYLYHIINNISNLDTFNIFLQGDPIFHGINTDRINFWLKEGSINSDFKFTKNFQVNSVFCGLNNQRRPSWKGKTEPSRYNMSQWINTYIKKRIPTNNAKIYFGANFGVIRDKILSRPTQDYIDILDNELSTINPEAGHYIERLWYYLFNMDQ